MDPLDGHTLETRCPDCGRPIIKTVGWLKLRRSMNCTWCGTLIATDREGWLADLEKGEKALGGQCQKNFP
jgi:ribosomal protein S27E